ncbi:MAG: phosphoenolpyruvate carboxykinase (ATP), partial [Sulfurovum sp.]|nr:phosphoenolpyruvate carboxykinase (ATP) [Sulfurovum sp.]NNJ46177.1 phosphoenolpyruvate carboxykinase (ATP) [Sulfurovum sp.]
CITGILDGSINECEFDTTNTFGFSIPKTLNGVDTAVLNPSTAWKDRTEYEKTRDKLAEMFIENFKRYNDESSEFDYSAAGPQL